MLLHENRHNGWWLSTIPKPLIPINGKPLATLFTHPNNHPADSGLMISKDGVVKQWLTKEDLRPEWYKNRVNAGLHIINTEMLELSGIKQWMQTIR